MENQLTNEINSLSDTQLLEYIELFQDRLETVREYLADEDDGDVRWVMRSKMQEFSYKLRLLQEERKRRNI